MNPSKIYKDPIGGTYREYKKIPEFVWRIANQPSKQNKPDRPSFKQFTAGTEINVSKYVVRLIDRNVEGKTPIVSVLYGNSQELVIEFKTLSEATELYNRLLK